MEETFKPETTEQTVEAVAWAAAEEAPLEIVGMGSKRGLGRPVQASQGLNLSGLSGILLYEPEELILSARAGTPLAEIEAALTEKSQIMAFEPPDFGPLLGTGADAGSIGGVLACNLSGSRRIKAGAARDHFLGVKAVSGRGELFKSGGRVVKNVTGYDLCKLLTGSYGTLAAMTEVTVKVLPAPEKTRTVLVYGLDDDTARRAMTRAMGSSHEVSGAAHLPRRIAAVSEVGYLRDADAATTALRIEGPAASVAHRCAALRRELADLGETEELHGQNSRLPWRSLCGGGPFVARPELAVWRLSLAPRDGPAVAAEIADGGDMLHYYDWGGGLLWLALPMGDNADQDRVRAAIAARGGHATLIRAAEAVRAAAEVFQPQDPANAALTRRVKDGFDPRRILNPGRMYPGV